jgi:hypothetical protein
VYIPEVEIVPTVGLRPHVTAVFEDPPTVGVNCFVCAAISMVEAGVSEIVTLFSTLIVH